MSEGQPQSGVNHDPQMSLDSILVEAKAKLASLTELVESAKIILSNANELQKTSSNESATLLSKAETAEKNIQQFAASAEEAQKQLVAALTNAHAKIDEISAIATKANAAATQIQDNQAVIATKSEHIQDAQVHADKVRAELDRTLTAAKQQLTETEGYKARAQSSSDSVTALAGEIKTLKGAADTDATKVAAALKVSEDSAAKNKALAEKSQVIEERITGYEKRLTEFEKQYADQLNKITELLPGATTVGLAHSFDDRRKKFMDPVKRWQWLFVGSVIMIVLLTVSGLWHTAQTGVAPSYDELFRLWLVRLPVVGALIWLALYSSRESALAKRLEEDYGYKAAIASCFEGFQRQMSEVGKGVAPDSALAKLLNNTLETIAAPPGRIYEQHQLTITPTDELKDLAKATAEAAKTLKDTPKT